MLKIFIFFAFLAFLSYQLTTQPSYSALLFITMGKVDALTSLTSETQGWVPYTVTFSKTLPTMNQIEATVSLISFDSLTSN